MSDRGQMPARPAAGARALLGLAALACAPGSPSSPGSTTGTISVGVSSSGSDVPDGYEVRLGEDEARPIGSSGGVSFEGIAPGTYAVELLSLPANCTVEGSNPRTVVVSEAATAPVSFSVACTLIPRGDLSVTTTTSGQDLDGDGYVVRVNGGSDRAIGINDIQVFTDLLVGDYEVSLGDLADNCAIQGENPRTLPISDGQTTPTIFAVVCELTTGAIRVSVSTSGFAQDPDGYTVELDGTTTLSVESDGSVTFETVTAGDHRLTLGDISSNCEVEGDNPANITVTAGQTADVEFEVECALF